MTIPSPSPGPRPAVRSGDEAAQEIWRVLTDIIGDPDSHDKWNEGVVHGYVSALFWLTGEPHPSIRARAVKEAAGAKEQSK